MANDNMITLRKSMGHLKILREFLDSKGGYRDINHIPPLELDSPLRNSVVNLRTKNGGEYQP